MFWHNAPQAAHSTKEKIRIGAVPFTLARFCNASSFPRASVIRREAHHEG
jgi:hypothetical protein